MSREAEGRKQGETVDLHTLEYDLKAVPIGKLSIEMV